MASSLLRQVLVRLCSTNMKMASLRSRIGLKPFTLTCQTSLFSIPKVRSIYRFQEIVETRTNKKSEQNWIGLLLFNASIGKKFLILAVYFEKLPKLSRPDQEASSKSTNVFEQVFLLNSFIDCHFLFCKCSANVEFLVLFRVEACN